MTTATEASVANTNRSLRNIRNVGGNPTYNSSAFANECTGTRVSVRSLGHFSPTASVHTRSTSGTNTPSRTHTISCQWRDQYPHRTILQHEPQSQRTLFACSYACASTAASISYWPLDTLSRLCSVRLCSNRCGRSSTTTE